MDALLLFADDTSRLMDIAHTAIIGIGIAVATLFIAWLNNSRRLYERIDKLDQKCFKLSDDVMNCEASKAEGLVREVQLKNEVAVQLKRILVLEKGQGITHDSVMPGGGEIMCDTSGIIKTFSTSLVPLLKYAQAEVKNKPVTMLMMDDDRVKFEKAFERFNKQIPLTIDPQKLILANAKDRDGNKVPVAVTLSEISEGGQIKFIVASIRLRTPSEDSVIQKIPDYVKAVANPQVPPTQGA